MLAWLKYWFTRPEPQPQPMPTIKVFPRELCPRNRYTMSPPRILEWWAQDPVLDSLPAVPEEPRGPKGEV